MRTINIHRIGLLALLSLLLLSGCEHEFALSEQAGGEEASAEKVQLEIFARANSYHLPSTKGLMDEGTVGKNPWVFVFRGEGPNATFVEAVQAFELSGKRYVTLTKQSNGSKYQLLILANSPGKFYYGDAITKYEFDETGFAAQLVQGSTTLADFCTNMLTAPLAVPSVSVLPYSGNGQVIPMSYLLEVDRIDHTTKIENPDGTSLMLTRAIAKMVIVNKTTSFELKGIVAVMNVSRQGQFHTLDGLIRDNTSNLTEYRNDAAYSSLLVQADFIEEGESTENNPVYLYESDVRNNTYLIIQGTYGGRDYFYKMAIVNKDAQLMDLQRNHSYLFTIVTAKGPGYDTVEDAKASKPSNTALDYEISIDNRDSYEVVANNDFFLGVSNSVFIAYTSENVNFEVFKLITDCRTHFPNACRISDNGNEVGIGIPLLVNPFNGARIPIVDDTTSDPNVTAVEAQISNALFDHACITLKLGTLEKTVRIRQRYAIPAAGVTIKYMPTTDSSDSFDMNYYCLSAYVEDGADDPKSWIKLRPSAGAVREDTDKITVDDGKIYIEVLANTMSKRRSGIVYLTTIKDPGISPNTSSVQRIKLNISQLSQTVVED